MSGRIHCERCGSKIEAPDSRGRWKCSKCLKPSAARPEASSVDSQHTLWGLGDEITSPSAETPALRIGNYELTKRLSRGRIGEVYLARLGGAEGFETEVLLKLLHPHLAQDPIFTNTLLEEAKSTVLLHHPHIVQLYNLERTNDLLYLVMEYVPGDSLELIQRRYREKNRRISFGMAIYVVCAVLEGLAYAHDMTDHTGQALSIVHADLAPQNILITEEGWVKIIDFGISRATFGVWPPHLDVSQRNFGYMAPEQWQGISDLRADLFSVGVMLFEMLTGENLFMENNRNHPQHKRFDTNIMKKIRSQPVIGPGMHPVFEKALSFDPRLRYASARDFRVDLMRLIAPLSLDYLKNTVDVKAEKREWDGSLKEALPRDFQPRPRPRWHLAWWTVGLGLIAGLALAMWWFWPFSNGALTTGVEQVQTAVGLPLPGDEIQVASSQVETKPDPVPQDSEKISQKKNEKKKKRGTSKASSGSFLFSNVVVQKAMRQRAVQFQQCAQLYLPKTSGEHVVDVAFKFVVEENGKVGKVSLLPLQLVNTPLGKCLVDEVKKVRFPKGGKESVGITFPLYFKVVR